MEHRDDGKESEWTDPGFHKAVAEMFLMIVALAGLKRAKGERYCKRRHRTGSVQLT